MIAKAGRIIQKMRWLLDPNQWMIRWLRLSTHGDAESRKGLVLVQVDGLSHTHLLKALRRGRLPFLKRLLKKEHYQDWHHYSGLPSSTPSIQGELFYGVKQSVPAFKFRDHKTGKIFTFYDSNAAAEVESRLRGRGEALLGSGSSYSNIFCGGAGENAHFCASSVGWTSFFKALNPLNLLMLLLFNLPSFFRLLFFWKLELLLSLFDAFAGSLKGYGCRQELMFILSRLIVSVGLRELAVLGCRLDMARGLPVIHVNFFGYDDQAHRRGPASAFAYWALPGIDDAVKRIWNSAQNALPRDYEVWIYSDHGQEEVVPYESEAGAAISEAVEDVFENLLPGETRKTVVTAQGPVGFIYPPRPLSGAEKEQAAEVLVRRKNVPMVMALMGGKVFAFTREGRFALPQETGKITGSRHPYLEEVGMDMESLCRHPDAGELVISGWRKRGRSVSFPPEYGSHAGPGPHETDGFVLLPREIRVSTEGKNYLRPLTLRSTALGYLKSDERVFHRPDASKKPRRSLRVMTYNVHSCVGLDGKLSPERIARVISRHDPDVIALQELDSGRLRSGGVDQARRIAELLNMEHHFHSVRMVEEEMFGNAVLSRYPMEVVRAAALPRLRSHAYFEPRGALWVEIRFAGEAIQIINTHLSFWSKEQKKQAEALCGPDWLSHDACVKNIIFCGDFNAAPRSPACRLFQDKLEDVQLKSARHKPLNTWFSRLPMGRIDHIFVDKAIGVVKVEVPSSRLEKVSSDHLPLIAELHIPPGRACGGDREAARPEMHAAPGQAEESERV